MTPEKQRIAIGIACGCKWTTIHKGLWVERLQTYIPLPDYLGDLNACHEMEKVLRDDQVATYVTTLCLEVQPTPMLHHATASEKCEAFLRTLGLWEEDAPADITTRERDMIRVMSFCKTHLPLQPTQPQ